MHPPILSPSGLREKAPCAPEVRALVQQTREEVKRILDGNDDRLLVVIGPCSIHDASAALEYAQLLAFQRTLHGADLCILMRVYFEKARTAGGWKGWINDPTLDGRHAIEQGLISARTLLLRILSSRIPAATECVNPLTLPYLEDLLGWAAVGARTVTSPPHRELASSTPFAVGFKNNVDGNVTVAIEAIQTAQLKHHFLTLNSQGRLDARSSAGNPYGHLILRGGGGETNYSPDAIDSSCQRLRAAALRERLMVDVGHANCGYDYQRQTGVAHAVGRQIAQGEQRIIGVMVESHLVEGKQQLIAGKSLNYGQSITDGCIGWSESAALLAKLAQCVRDRRAG